MSKKKSYRRPCVGPFSHMGIRWDGKVSACCRDFNAKLKMGDINDSSIEEIWNSERMNNLRMAFIKGDLTDFPYCAGCEGQTSPYITDQEIVEYLEEMGEEQEIGPYLERASS